MFEKRELNSNPFFIAEVGQNHNGDLQKALEYIEVFSKAGASAIKFQTRDNKFLFDVEAYNKPYESENAYAKSYGAHREFLELNKEDYPILFEQIKPNQKTKFGKMIEIAKDKIGKNILLVVITKKKSENHFRIPLQGKYISDIVNLQSDYRSQKSGSAVAANQIADNLKRSK